MCFIKTWVTYGTTSNITFNRVQYMYFELRYFLLAGGTLILLVKMMRDAIGHVAQNAVK